MNRKFLITFASISSKNRGIILKKKRLFSEEYFYEGVMTDRLTKSRRFSKFFILIPLKISATIVYVTVRRVRYTTITTN